jgi:hypothetical protein
MYTYDLHAHILENNKDLGFQLFCITILRHMVCSILIGSTDLFTLSITSYCDQLSVFPGNVLG